MLEGRTRERILAATAIAYALLMAGGWAAWAGQGLPALNGPATEISAWFVQHHDACRIAAIMGSLSLFPLVWYLVCLYGMLRDAEGGDGAVSLVLLGSGLMTVVFDMMFCQFLLTAAFRPGETLPAVTQALNDLYLGPGVAALSMYVAMFVAIALVVLRTGVLPVSLGYGAVAVAATQLLFVPTSFVHDGIFDISRGLLGVYVPFGSHIVWILVSGVVVVQRVRAPRAVVTPAAVGRALP